MTFEDRTIIYSILHLVSWMVHCFGKKSKLLSMRFDWQKLDNGYLNLQNKSGFIQLVNNSNSIFFSLVNNKLPISCIPRRVEYRYLSDICDCFSWLKNSKQEIFIVHGFNVQLPTLINESICNISPTSHVKNKSNCAQIIAKLPLLPSEKVQTSAKLSFWLKARPS